jgi:hypothetical protein
MCRETQTPLFGPKAAVSLLFWIIKIAATTERIIPETPI